MTTRKHDNDNPDTEAIAASRVMAGADGGSVRDESYAYYRVTPYWH